MSDMSDSSSISGYGAPARPGGPTAGSADPPTLDVAGMLDKINAMRIDAASTAAARHAATQRAELRAGLTPSGPRKPGQGCEDQDQAILLAEPTGTGGVRLRITLLAAGFIIGPIGGCIREISRITGADVRSRTVAADARCHRDCREFTLEGPDAAVAHAMSIMADAVKRYKILCEGGCAGQVVSRSQHVAGVEFFYQPPPRSVVPYAACLKGHSRRGSGTASKVALKHGSQPVPPPKGSPSTANPTFKDAVTGGSGDEAESSPLPGPAGLLKRAASASPRLMAGDALLGADGDVLDSIIASSPLMSGKVSKGDDGAAEAAQIAFAAGLGLPVSLGLSEGPDNRMMVPLDLLLASQALLAQGSGHGGVGSPTLGSGGGGGGGVSPASLQQRTYPAGDLMSALASQIDGRLGVNNRLGLLDSQVAGVGAAPPTPGVPFFGHYQGPQQQHQQQAYPVVHFQEGNVFENGAQHAQHAQQGQASAFAAAAAAAEGPTLDPSAASTGKPALSPGFHAPGALASRAASLPTTLGLRSAAVGPPPGFNAGDDSVSLRSAFHVPGMFRGATMGPTTPAPSCALSLSSAFSGGGGGGGGGGLSAAPSLERAISGSLFQATDGSAAIATAAAAGHHRVAAAAWSPGDAAGPAAADGASAPEDEAELPLPPNIWAL